VACLGRSHAYDLLARQASVIIRKSSVNIFSCLMQRQSRAARTGNVAGPSLVCLPKGVYLLIVCICIAAVWPEFASVRGKQAVACFSTTRKLNDVRQHRTGY
jgi:hypothetical protein